MLYTFIPLLKFVGLFGSNFSTFSKMELICFKNELVRLPAIIFWHIFWHTNNVEKSKMLLFSKQMDMEVDEDLEMAIMGMEEDLEVSLFRLWFMYLNILNNIVSGALVTLFIHFELSILVCNIYTILFGSWFCLSECLSDNGYLAFKQCIPIAIMQ